MKKSTTKNEQKGTLTMNELNFEVNQKNVTEIVKKELEKAQKQDNIKLILLYKSFLKHSKNYGKLPYDILNETLLEIFNDNVLLVRELWYKNRN